MTVTPKAIVFDCENNYGGALTGLRQVEFTKAGVVIPIVEADAVFYAKEISSSYNAKYAFLSSTSKLGASSLNSWLGDFSSLSQRLVINFNVPPEWDGIVINNWHYYSISGSLYTDRGVKNLKIYISDNPVTSLVYGEAIPDSTLVFDGVLARHPASNVADNQVLTLDLPVTPEPAEIVFNPTRNETLFRLTLTGSNEDPPVSDSVLKMSSFSAYIKTGEPSNLSCVVPWKFSQEIADRPNGELVISHVYRIVDGVEESEELIRVNLSKVVSSVGAVNRSWQLSGEQQETYTAGTAVALPKIMTMSPNQGDGKYTISAKKIIPGLRPGTDVSYNGISFVVDTIQINASVGNIMVYYKE